MKIRDLPNQSSQFTLLFGYLLLFGFIIYSTTLGRSFTALTPHNYDAQFFAYIGSQWAQGKIPYVDIWDNKPPGIFALTAIVSSYFPDIFQALSVIEGIFIIGCITTIYLLMKQLGAPRSATVLSTVAAAAACNLFYYNERGLLTEVYLLWPATMSMFLFVIGIHRSQQIWLVLSGICTGVALLFITIGLSLYLVQLVFLAWTCAVRRYPCRYSLFSALSPSIGIILLWLIPITYFHLHDGFMDLLDASLFYNFTYGVYSQPDLSIIPFKLAYNLRPLSSLVLCAFIVASYLVICAFHALRGDKSAKVSLSSNYSIGAALVLLWFFFDLIGSLAGGRFYPHYFLAITPSIAAVSGFAYWSIIGGEFAVGSKAIRASVFALIIGPLLFFQIEDIQTAQTHTKKSQPIIS